MKILKYLSKIDLIELNRAAIREKRNRFASTAFIDSLPDDVRCLVIEVMWHTKNEVRLTVVVNEDCDQIVVDASRTRYESLPAALRLDDQSFLIENSADAESRRPYPNRREWQESLTKKPVRKQQQFRERVLRAYNGRCGVCDVHEAAILRAAHIIGVVDRGTETINNGICLCVNHEIAFDQGIMLITNNFEIVCQADNNFEIKYTDLRLPAEQKDWPSEQFLQDKVDKIKSGR